MNESYLSRGKRKDNGEWVIGYYAFLRKRRGVFGQVMSELDRDRHLIIDVWGHSHEVIPETVCRCTELKDKNSKLIFEGDIVRAYKHNETQYTQAITLRDGCFWFGSWNWIEFLNVFRNLEVIGNIHDNPELLEAMANDR